MTHECSVCFDTIDPCDIYKSSCGHGFHNSCITQWLASKNTCPICRYQIYEAPEEELEEEDDDRFLINYTNAYNDQLTNLLHNFIVDAMDYDEERWTCDPLGFDYVHAFSHRKINGRNTRIFTILQKHTNYLDTKSVFMGEIVSVQDISKPPKQIAKKENKINKNQKIKKNFNYHRNRRNFVGRRFIRT